MSAVEFAESKLGRHATRPTKAIGQGRNLMAQDITSDNNKDGKPTPDATGPAGATVPDAIDLAGATAPDATDPTDATASGMPSTEGTTAPDATGSESAAGAKPKMSLKKRLIIAAVILVCAAAIIFAIVMADAKNFTGQEHAVRSDWSVETGDMLNSDAELSLDIYESSATSEDLRIIQLVPSEVEDEGFTYYDEEVQSRLASGVADVKDMREWTADNPLAILNPFGTGSNGLHLYFETDFETQVTYTVHVEKDGIEDFTATAQNTFLDEDIANSEGDAEYTRAHEFQLIGLVPGETNYVTLTITGSWGNVRQQVTFAVDMPETTSGYSTQLSYEDGDSSQELSNGLYALVRQNGYLGYGFFFDNGGTMRYEMVTEGLGLDRILEYEGDIVVCASSNKLARIDGLGRAVQTYDLGEYELHHDINYEQDNVIVALAERSGTTSVEDLVIEIDLETGDVTELIDFTQLMSDYVDGWTHVIGPTDTFFWQAGELDWIHLNSIQWLEDEDSCIVSSRETSTIIKVENVHSDPTVTYLIGDERFWEGTPYEDLSLEQVGSFTPQYGQHAVEFDGSGEEAGTYHLLLYDNNYWALSTRSGYVPDLADSVATGTYDVVGAHVSHVYRYLVDENAGTYELVDAFDVPYSSIVSNASHAPESDNYVVNSGISKVFGEYDSDGNLIREFAYECDLQGYRAFKLDFKGFWFMQ